MNIRLKTNYALSTQDHGISPLLSHLTDVASELCVVILSLHTEVRQPMPRAGDGHADFTDEPQGGRLLITRQPGAVTGPLWCCPWGHWVHPVG